MARPRIVDRDIGAAKAGLQYSFILGAERLEFGRQQTHHLPLRNHHAHAIEKSGYPFASDLPGEVKRQHQAMQTGAIAADKPRIESRDDRLAVRRFPTFATISRHLWVQAQVLNNDVLKSLVARARRRVDLHNNGCANLQSVELAATPAQGAPTLLVASVRSFGLRRFIHAGGLDRRTQRPRLQPRTLILDSLVLDP